jgi:predicted RNase H-like HicB family nuclease
MLKIYPAVYKQEADRVVCHFPDLPEIEPFSGKDKDAVAEEAKDVLGRYYVKKSQIKETIPDPSNARLMEAGEGETIEYVYTDIDKYWTGVKAKDTWI